MDFVASLSNLNLAEESLDAALRNGDNSRGLGFLGTAMAFLSDFYAVPIPPGLSARAEKLRKKFQDLMPNFSINSVSSINSRGDSFMRYDNSRTEQIAANVVYQMDSLGSRNPALKPSIILAIHEISSLVASYPEEQAAGNQLIRSLQDLLASLPESTGASLSLVGDSYGGSQVDPTCYGLALGFNGDPRNFGISHQNEPEFEAMQAAYFQAQRGAR